MVSNDSLYLWLLSDLRNWEFVEFWVNYWLWNGKLLFHKIGYSQTSNDVVSGFLLICLIGGVRTWCNKRGSVQNWIKWWSFFSIFHQQKVSFTTIVVRFWIHRDFFESLRYGTWGCWEMLRGRGFGDLPSSLCCAFLITRVFDRRALLSNFLSSSDYFIIFFRQWPFFLKQG